MKNNWRPPNWQNPHPYPVRVEHDKRLEHFLSERHKVFEAGADAILEELKATGMPTSPFMPNICELFDLGSHPDLKRQMILEKSGTVVFIPDNDVKKEE